MVINEKKILNEENIIKVPKYDVIISEVEPLCGEKINFYVNFAQGEIKELYFESCKCGNLTENIMVLTKLIKGRPVEYLSDDHFIELLSEKFMPNQVMFRDMALSLSDKILCSYYNKYFT